MFGMISSKVRTDYICLAMVIFIIAVLKTDVITGLMNRQSYEGRIPYVSVGYSRFDPDKNDCESCVKEADLQMYEWKQRSKEERKNS